MSLFTTDEPAEVQAADQRHFAMREALERARGTLMEERPDRETILALIQDCYELGLSGVANRLHDVVFQPSPEAIRQAREAVNAAGSEVAHG